MRTSSFPGFQPNQTINQMASTGAIDLHPWLQPFGLIDSDSEAVKAAVAEATQGCTSEEEKAVAIYRYVRDRILFGFSSGFGELKC